MKVELVISAASLDGYDEAISFTQFLSFPTVVARKLCW
jgi:hypothetical protein